jgi:hypothetical protein
LYYPDGRKVEEKLDMDPNSQLLPELDKNGKPIIPKKPYPIMYPYGSTTLENVTARSVALFTPEILASIEAKLRPQTAGRTRRRRSKRKTRRLK